MKCNHILQHQDITNTHGGRHGLCLPPNHAEPRNLTSICIQEVLGCPCMLCVVVIISEEVYQPDLIIKQVTDEFVIDRRSYTHNLSTCGITA